MVRVANKLLLILLVLGLAFYVFWLNPGKLTVFLAPNSPFTAPAAVIFVSLFALGVVFCALFAFFFGFKAYWRERKLLDRERKRELAYQRMLKARSSLCAGDWDKAREEWQAIIKQSPSDVIARVELSRCLEGDGEVREALKVLDAARSFDPTNIEVLFRAAELNLALNNKTAAIDNLALILYHHPNKKAAKLARDLSESLDRIEDSLEYQTLLERLGERNQESEQVLARLQLKRLEADYADDPEKLRAELKKFTKNKSHFVPALRQRAMLESEAGDIEEAAKLLLQAGKASSEPSYWQEAAKLWIKAGNPDRAVAAARAGTDQTKGLARAQSELELIKLYLTLNMVDAARDALDNFDALLRNEEVQADASVAQSLLILRGRCYNMQGEFKKSAKIWEELSGSSFDLDQSILDGKLAVNESAPSPSLSTP